MTGRVLEESIRSYADEIYKITAENKKENVKCLHRTLTDSSSGAILR